MGRTRSQLRSNVFQLFGEGAGYITPNDINEWLKEGYSEYASLSKYLVAYQTLPVINNMIILPVGFDELIYIDSGNKTYWVEYEMITNAIILRPYDNNEVPAQVNLKYFSSPSSTSGAVFPQLTDDNSTTALSEMGDKALIYYALSRCYQADNRNNIANDTYRKFIDSANVEFTRIAKLHTKPTIFTSAWSGKITRMK